MMVMGIVDVEDETMSLESRRHACKSREGDKGGWMRIDPRRRKKITHWPLNFARSSNTYLSLTKKISIMITTN